LLANRGKPAKVELNDKTLYSGTIHEVLVERLPVSVAEPHLEALGLTARGAALRPAVARKPAADAAETHTLTGISGGNFVLRTEEGDVLLSAASIRSLTLKDMKTTIAKSAKTTRSAKRLSFRYAEGGKKQSLALMYFRPGVRWIPTYRLNLGEK